MAKNLAPAKTPGVAIARVLRGLGLKQGLDFGVRAERKNGERIGTRVAVFGRTANQTVADNANLIEQQAGDAGFHFNVSIYFTPSGQVWVHVANFGTKTRQTHFLSATPAEPTEAAEDQPLRDRAVALADESMAERTEVPQPEQCSCECTWKCDRPADEPCTCPCVCGAALAAEVTPAPEQHADLSTEDGTVKLGRDELTRRGHWADVTLAVGRAYSVSLKVHRKGTEGASTILVDHVIYWTETAGRSPGPIRIACPDDKPGSVGGRIWRLLLAANIA